ncbi:phosphotransferase, partial [Frankia sp. Cas3]|uniref:phosphotransferase n=1 Tax=Frankia sp. Cas3 TaxID=3073926 RepID=UPI003A0FEB69
MVAADGSGRTAADGDRFGWVDALRTLDHACAVVGLAAEKTRPMRLGENAIICLDSPPVVARIARTVDYLPDVTKEVAVARWFASIDFPAVRLLPAIDQPLVIDGRVVTFWRQVGTGAEHGNLTDLAAILRRLHHLATPPDLELPAFRPFRRTRRRLANAQVRAA